MIFNTIGERIGRFRDKFLRCAGTTPKEFKIATFTFEKAHFRKCRMKNITDYLEKEQVDEMLRAARSCSERDYLLMRVLWRSGVRIDELLNLRPRDVERLSTLLTRHTQTRGSVYKLSLIFYIII